MVVADPGDPQVQLLAALDDRGATLVGDPLDYCFTMLVKVEPTFRHIHAEQDRLLL